MLKKGTEIKVLSGFIPVVIISGRQTSETEMEWRADYHPNIEQQMTPEEWKAFNDHIEKAAALIEEASRRPPKQKRR